MRSTRAEHSSGLIPSSALQWLQKKSHDARSEIGLTACLPNLVRILIATLLLAGCCLRSRLPPAPMQARSRPCAISFRNVPLGYMRWPIRRCDPRGFFSSIQVSLISWPVAPCYGYFVWASYFSRDELPRAVPKSGSGHYCPTSKPGGARHFLLPESPCLRPTI